MDKRPTIGVTTQTLDAIPDQLPLCWVMSQRYVRVLTSAGAVPWIVPLMQADLETLRAIYEQIDGVFLPGGVDVDPRSYREERHEFCGRTDEPRDWAELQMTQWALEEGKPLLAVCRGVQVMNVALGGTLYQDLGAQVPGILKHDYFPIGGRYSRDTLVHDVRVADGSRLAELLGTGEVMVNSMHHQGIKTLATGLIPTAFAPDGLIEAVEVPNGPFQVGVQWHPEDLVDSVPCMRKLFDAFIEASLEFRTARTLGIR